VLVQNMEQWSPALGNLWHAFDFIPQWQRDDIMVSYAPSGGSVGKHYDNYDVFLAQGYGKRHWQLGKYCDQTTQFEAGQPIRLMNEMGELIFDEVLEPGDVLYVPTNLSHYGVAIEDCLTFSFGFRRPTPLQLLDSLADVATHFDDLAIPLKINQPTAVAGELSIASIQDIKAQLIALLNSELGDEIITQAISETVSKRQYELMLPDAYADIDEIQSALAAGAVIMQDMSSRIIFTQADSKTQAKIYVNGCAIDADDIPANAQSLLIRLANGESVDEQILQAADVETDIICDWIENGWVVIDYPEDIIG
jgi:50S ribosomal protein L16 3-hydroxylase